MYVFDSNITKTSPIIIFIALEVGVIKFQPKADGLQSTYRHQLVFVWSKVEKLVTINIILLFINNVHIICSILNFKKLNISYAYLKM